jgi:aromatic ring hydroxylase
VDAKTGEVLLDPERGGEVHEDRYLRTLAPQIAEIYDLHFGPAQKTYWTPSKSLGGEVRFRPAKPRKKKP